MSVYLAVEPRDNVVARDSRPFGGGSGRKMRSLEFPYPQLPAGTLRTMLGKLLHWNFDDSQVGSLLNVACHGPLLERCDMSGSELWFRAPLDLVLQKDAPPHRLRARPVKDVGPDALPRMAFLSVKDEFKPVTPPPFLPQSYMSAWLTGKGGPLPENSFIKPVETEERVHVRIDPETGAAEETFLFSSAGLRFHRDFRMSFRAHATDPALAGLLAKLDECHPMGGERRLAFWRTTANEPRGWRCPAAVSEALGKTDKVRMMLATPGLFSKGYLPGWLAAKEPVPGTSVRLQCAAAACGRWQPVSGWSYERKTRGPKAIRRLAPAGSVYFCEVIAGSAAELSKAWLQPVSDGEQDRRDGYGLALFGTWSD